VPLAPHPGRMDASEPSNLLSKVPRAGSGSDAVRGRAEGMGRHSQFGQNHWWPALIPSSRQTVPRPRGARCGWPECRKPPNDAKRLPERRGHHIEQQSCGFLQAHHSIEVVGRGPHHRRKSAAESVRRQKRHSIRAELCASIMKALTKIVHSRGTNSQRF
jgi:hypothetical protein